jgi:hypothetical protein
LLKKQLNTAFIVLLNPAGLGIFHLHGTAVQTAQSAFALPGKTV